MSDINATSLLQLTTRRNTSACEIPASAASSPERPRELRQPLLIPFLFPLNLPLRSTSSFSASFLSLSSLGSTGRATAATSLPSPPLTRTPSLASAAALPSPSPALSFYLPFTLFSSSSISFLSLNPNLLLVVADLLSFFPSISFPSLLSLSSLPQIPSLFPDTPFPFSSLPPMTSLPPFFFFFFGYYIANPLRRHIPCSSSSMNSSHHLRCYVLSSSPSHRRLLLLFLPAAFSFLPPPSPSLSRHHFFPHFFPLPTTTPFSPSPRFSAFVARRRRQISNPNRAIRFPPSFDSPPSSLVVRLNECFLNFFPMGEGERVIEKGKKIRVLFTH